MLNHNITLSRTIAKFRKCIVWYFLCSICVMVYSCNSLWCYITWSISQSVFFDIGIPRNSQCPKNKHFLNNIHVSEFFLLHYFSPFLWYPSYLNAECKVGVHLKRKRKCLKHFCNNYPTPKSVTKFYWYFRDSKYEENS